MISTHILDTSLGNPAQGVSVDLEKKSADGSWSRVDRGLTNADGRIAFNCPHEAGTYRLQFHIEPYFRKNGLTPFFIEAPVHFEISNTARKYHVPLLLNPYGYSTYRGS